MGPFSFNKLPTANYFHEKNSQKIRSKTPEKP